MRSYLPKSRNSLCSSRCVRSPTPSVVAYVCPQIYLDRNRANSKRILERVEKEGYSAVILTVDSAVPGKRERDQKAKGDFQVNVRCPLWKKIAHVIRKAPATEGANTNGTLGVAQVR